MIDELLAEARAAATSGLALETFSELRGAAHLYRSHGFELRWEQTGPAGAASSSPISATS